MCIILELTNQTDFGRHSDYGCERRTRTPDGDPDLAAAFRKLCLPVANMPIAHIHYRH